jgi:hypothetical protein
MPRERDRLAVVVTLLLAVLSAGCSTNGTQPASSGGTPVATVAFDAIDGPPPELSRKLTQAFAEQARARQVIIVSREGLPHYRIHGQLTARSERGRTTVAWVWDVYDSQKRRALHITGEEVAVPVGRDPWATLDDQAVGRIALGGVEPLVTFLASPGAIAASEAAPRTPAAVSDDFTPEASGIFRVFRSVWPKSEDKKPAAEEPPARTSEAPAARPVSRIVAGDQPTDYSGLPARAR